MNWETEFGLLTVNAATFHLSQTRKGKKKDGLRIPFIIHPLQILRKVQKWGITLPSETNKVFWKACLFHDSKEDSCIDDRYLINIIGEYAANLVKELTFIPKFRRGMMDLHNTPIPSLEEQKAEYLSSFKTKSIDALVLKLADRFCNIEDFEIDDQEYAIKYTEKAKNLFKIAIDRKSEISGRFGFEVCDNIMKEINLRLN